MEKKPFLTLEQAKEIIKDIPTPFHVYDEKGIRENARALNKAFSWNKGYKEFFAVKATPNPFLMQILHEEGCGMDCSSYTELMLCESCGITGEEIMFSSNVTPAEDMKKAFDLGANINLDDYTHVEFIKKVCGVPKTICCRYNPGGVFRMADSEDKVQVMDTPGDSKYGMTEEQMEKAFVELKAAGAEEFGIHAFLASNTVSNGYYPELAGILFRLAVRKKKKTGVHIKFINIDRRSPKMILLLSVKASEKSLRRSLYRQVWMTSPSIRSLADICWRRSVLWLLPRSTKSISTRNISVWMPARQISCARRCTAPTIISRCSEKKTSHATTSTMSPVVFAKITTNLPSTECCPKSTSAILFISTTRAHTASRWAITTTESFVLQRFCSAKTAVTS